VIGKRIDSFLDVGTKESRMNARTLTLVASLSLQFGCGGESPEVRKKNADSVFRATGERVTAALKEYKEAITFPAGTYVFTLSPKIPVAVDPVRPDSPEAVDKPDPNRLTGLIRFSLVGQPVKANADAAAVRYLHIRAYYQFKSDKFDPPYVSYIGFGQTDGRELTKDRAPRLYEILTK
jgi:hypothetical protein